MFLYLSSYYRISLLWSIYQIYPLKMIRVYCISLLLYIAKSLLIWVFLNQYLKLIIINQNNLITLKLQSVFSIIPWLMWLTLHVSECILYLESWGLASAPYAPTNGRMQLQADALNSRLPPLARGLLWIVWQVKLLQASKRSEYYCTRNNDLRKKSRK